MKLSLDEELPVKLNMTSPSKTWTKTHVLQIMAMFTPGAKRGLIRKTMTVESLGSGLYVVLLDVVALTSIQAPAGSA